MIFWLVCAVMLLIALAFVLPPLWQQQEKDNAAEVKEANIAVYQDQLRELDTELANGLMSKEQHDQDREEIERRLLQDVSASPAPAKEAKLALTDRTLAYAVGFA